MKKYNIILLVSILLTLFGCEKYLDVNKNPNAPQEVAPNLYLGPILSQMSMAPQWDGRYIGKYSQMWVHNSANDVWDGMGFLFGNDANSEIWRTVYWLMGYNLKNMIEQSIEEERWDMVGIGYVFRAWGWQMLTDLHSDIIVSEAFDLSKTKFKYDEQAFVYEEVEKDLLEAIKYLNREDGAVSAGYMAVGDPVYNGNREKWKRFAYGLLAYNRGNLTNKTSLYDPEYVVSLVDSAFVDNNDDALFPYSGTRNATTPFYSPGRNNFSLFRQSDFILNLLNGVSYGVLSGTKDTIPDPRLERMLAWSPDSTYNGLVATRGYDGMPTKKMPMQLIQYTASPTNPTEAPGKYIFHNKARIPMMTYAQLQFIKAEAAYYKNDKELALEAYKNGIKSHIEFVNMQTKEANRDGVKEITEDELEELMNNEHVIPNNANNLTLSHILGQKYIVQWGWAFVQAWTDLRRYHYIDLDPISNEQVFLGFNIPPSDRMDTDNQGKPVYRVRGRYNSEYIWNQEEVERIGGMERDYHTNIMWLFEKQ